MKELSIEEKAKAYDEVHEKIAIRFGSNVADEIFSKYEMSEDEKIRKWLVEELYKSVNSPINKGFDIDMGGKALAWLEKQGEQKPTDEEMKELLHTEYEKGRADAIAEMQKPWSEEDETMITLLHNIIGHHYSMDIIKKEEQLKLEDWLKYIKERVQPKQELSEKDEAVLDALIRRLEGEDVYVSPHLAVKCLKFLRPQKQWKPSKEQINGLNEIVNHFAESQVIHENSYLYNIAVNLMEQLKAL